MLELAQTVVATVIGLALGIPAGFWIAHRFGLLDP